MNLLNLQSAKQSEIYIRFCWGYANRFLPLVFKNNCCLCFNSRSIDNIKFKKFDFPRSVAAAITLLVMIGALVGFISLFAPLIALEAQVISSIKVDDVLQNLDEPIAQVEALMGKYNITANTDTDYLQNKITELVNLSNITNIFSNIFGTLGNIFIAFFSISFICFFFLKEDGLFHQMLISFSPKKYVS